MNGRQAIITLLTVALLAACGGNQSATETSVPAAAPTSTAPAAGPTATATLAATESAVTDTPTSGSSPTPVATRPPNAADCTNSASFVADVTIPDNTEVQGGETFTKTWRILNTGTCIWASDYTLSHYSDEQMNAPASVPLPVTFPGQNADISIDLTAPNSVGIHRANFVIKNPAGLIMKVNDDSRLWLIINVKLASNATATTAPVESTSVVPTNTSIVSSGATPNTSCSFSIDQSKLLDVISAVNAYRTQSGLFAYPVNPKLARAAQTHANDMACNQIFGHIGSNGSTLESRVTASGYTFTYVRENVYGSNPPLSGQDVVNFWINDQTDQNNKLNLISDTATEMGVGYAFFNNYGYYVIVFASP